MTRRLCFALTLVVLAAIPLVAGPWLDDLEAAKKAAAATGKPILVDVTGSDWCPPCQEMEAEVFSQPDFLPTLGNKYILLRLDYPRGTAQPERLRVQNQAFADRYPFDGFPTWYVLDAQGTAWGKQSGYQPGGVSAFAALADGLAAQGPALKALSTALAQAAPGGPRAQAADALFRQAEAWGLEFQYGNLPLQIVQDDKDGKAGLKARYQTYNAYVRLLSTWADRDNDLQAAADFDALADRAGPWPDLAQRILFTAGMVRLNALDDEIAARDTFRKARALGPGTPLAARLTELLDRLP
jgi:thiol-disulfide isomerase/thioredoxin